MPVLTEAVAKHLLRNGGLRTPAGVVVDDATEAARVADDFGLTVYVKAQVLEGDRLGRGLVRRMEVDDDVAAAAAAILEQAPAVLVEEAIAFDEAFYAAVVVDGASRSRQLLLGRGGGTGYRLQDAALRIAVPAAGLRPYELRGVLADHGWSGSRMVQAADALGALVDVARRWRCYVVEVNPLVRGEGGFVVLDAKAEIDDYAVALVPDPALLEGLDEGTEKESRARAIQRQDHRGTLRYVQLVDELAAPGGGTLVGSHSIGGGESMVVFDALADAGLRAANYCDTSGNPSREKVVAATRLIAGQRHIGAYFFCSCIANQPLTVTADGLVEGLDAEGWDKPLVARFAGNEEAEAAAIVRRFAEERSLPAVVVGRGSDEWDAAEALAELLTRPGNG